MITQEQINRLKWYHDFDFPGGLTARTRHQTDAAFYRLMWHYLAEQLRTVDFIGKAVIDIGCWDGYFSFMIEQWGAKRVLAVDDFSQNWGSPETFRIAHELYRSNAEFIPDLSVYELSRLVWEKFDIIFFSGVFYHLHSPFQAFAEIRALCHPASIVLIAGQCLRDEEHSIARFHFDQPRLQKFLPTSRLLKEMLSACYLDVTSTAFLSDLKKEDRLKLVNKADLLQLARVSLRDKHSATRKEPDKTDVVVMFAKPFVRENPSHQYPPPFGLAQFDPRWQG